MTKLLEWLSVAIAFLGVWYSIVFGYVKSSFFDNWMNIIIISPIIFAFMFATYSLTVVLYRVFTLSNCEEAAEELQKQIVEAKKDLQKRGFVSS